MPNLHLIEARASLAFTAAAAVLLVAACAKSPDSIAATPMPAGMYDAYACSQAQAERQNVASRLAALESQQRSAATGDALGVFLIGVPVSSLTGGDKEGQIATEKGKLLAIDARLTRC